jgi:hypothetical protein
MFYCNCYQFTVYCTIEDFHLALLSKLVEKCPTEFIPERMTIKYKAYMNFHINTTDRRYYQLNERKSVRSNLSLK